MRLLKILSIFPKLFKIYFAIEYYFYAWFKYTIHVVKGGNYKSRLNKFQDIEQKTSLIKSKNIKRLAIFVGFHTSTKFPISNSEYIKTLLDAEFFIIYVHNGPLDKPILDEISLLCDVVLCRPNIGFDCGAWKDTFLWLRNIGVFNTQSLEWFLICNDSNFFLGKSKAKDFINQFKLLLADKAVDLIALNKSYDSTQHYQSFFLCMQKSIFQSIRFERFWQEYLPLNHRFHSVNNCEIRLSQKILSKYTSHIIYDSSKLYAGIIKDNTIYSEFFLSVLPKNAMYLSSCVKGDNIFEFELQRILAILDFHNPSHAFALLFVEYLKSPFLKKDLVRQGSFSIPQIKSVLLRNLNQFQDPQLLQEIIDYYLANGLNTSYINSPRIAFRKGINPINGVGFGGSGQSLRNMGLK